MPAVHPWTIAWYDTLPEAYRMLDKNQLNPAPEAWSAYTQDPTFFTGWGDWEITAPIQAVDEVMISMKQTFRGISGEPVHTQIWWAAPVVEGIVVQIAVLDDADQPVSEVTAEALVGVADQLHLSFYPSIDGHFTVRILVLVPAPEGNMLEILGINVGPRIVLASDLPLGGTRAPTTRPLLRFMDGIGKIGGSFRDMSDNLWDGKYTNPATVPDHALRWLAQMMGVPSILRGQLDNSRLREYMADMTTSGRKGTGTLTAISEAARAFLTGNRMVEVIKHETLPHTLVILVKADEVPGGNLQGIIDTVRAAGVMPAGHDLIARDAIATWDAWEAAAGTTWTDVEEAAPTWVRADSLGINLEG